MAERERIVRAAMTADEAGLRLDRALHAKAPELSRTRLKGLILEGRVMRNGAAVHEPSLAVKAGEVFCISIPTPAEATPKAEQITLDILHEDKDVIVINKSSGLVVHPAPGHAGGTLVNALLHHCGDSLSGIGGVKRPGIVHRLDKDTSGVMVAAKNDAAHHSLSTQFADHTISRSYLAIVAGVPLPLEGEIKTLIARHAHHRQKMAVSKTRGKEAVTHYRVKEIFKAKGQGIAALVECTLFTGRTHQVRVHMAHIGHPILGDAVYGRGRIPKNLNGTAAGNAIAAFPRQALHAALLAFDHPSKGKRMTFKAPLPANLKALQKALKGAK